LNKALGDLEKRVRIIEQGYVHRMSVDALQDLIGSLIKDMAAMRKDFAIHSLLNMGEIAQLKGQNNILRLQIADLLARDWGFELHAETGMNYSPWVKRGNDEIANVNTIGGGIYMSRGRLFFRVGLGAGVNSVSQHFSWSFSASLEYMMSKHVLLGPYTSVSYDMGDDVKYPQLWLWSGGAIIRAHVPVHTPLSFFFKLGVGMFAERDGPDFYFGLGHATVGVSYGIL
jgi:hypothetical protein